MFSFFRRNSQAPADCTAAPEPEDRQRDWLDDMPDDERDRVIENVSRSIVKRGMETPAILFLEAHKPLAFFASQGLVVMSPFTAPFIGMDNVQIASKLIEKRENVELLILRIEELAVERDAAQRAAKQEAARRKKSELSADAAGVEP